MTCLWLKHLLRGANNDTLSCNKYTKTGYNELINKTSYQKHILLNKIQNEIKCNAKKVKYIKHKEYIKKTTIN